VKKEELKDIIRGLHAQLDRQRIELEAVKRDARQLGAEVENMRANWRPVPITHEWQPRNPQCALCDEPRDAARHQVERSVVPNP